MKYYEDPILGKGRAADVSGGTGSADYVGGTRIAIAGETISFVNSATIQNVTGNSVTLEPDTAYKITATASAVTLNANVPAAGSWAYEGHAEIFVAGTGYIVTGANVVLANPLEPDAVNNCVLRFHDGTCIIDVEDHVYGYIVTSISGTTQGTLPYGITSATSNYIAFDATTNGATVSLSGSTANGEKHLVGNCYTETTLTGAVDCGANKVTVANLGLNNVQVTGGVMTLGDAYIPSGSTVEITGGTDCTLSIERVSGDGVINRGNGNIQIEKNGVISGVTLNLNASNAKVVQSAGLVAFHGAIVTNGIGGYGSIQIPWQGFPYVSAFDCVFSGNSANNGGAFGFTFNQEHFFTSCSFVNNSATNGGVFVGSSAVTINLSACKFSGNVSPNANVIFLNDQAKVVMTDCSFGADQSIYARASATKVEMLGSNTMTSGAAIYGSGSAVISSGTVLDLTGNTNPTPIAPGGGITFEAGGATVLYSSGAVSGSYSMDNVNLPAGAKLTNTATVDLGGTHVVKIGEQPVNVSGCTFTSGMAPNAGNKYGGAFFLNQTTGVFSNCQFIGNNGNTSDGRGGGIYAASGSVQEAILSVVNCVFTGNVAYQGNAIYTLVQTTIQDCVFNANQSLYIRDTTATFVGTNVLKSNIAGNGSIIFANGATIDLTDNQIATPIAPGNGVVVDGGCTVITSAGASVSIAGGTYTKINNDGTTE